MGADVIKVEAVQRPDGIRFSADGAAEGGSAVLRDVGAVPRGRTSASAASRSTSANPTGLDAREAADRASPTWWSRTSRRVCSSSSASTTTRCAPIRPDVGDGAHARVRARGPVARPSRVRADDGADHRHGVGDRLRGRAADHSRAASVDPMVGAHAALAIVAALEHRDRTGEGQLVEVPLLEVATAVTAEQVIRYSIDGTMLDRRGTGGVYRDARRRRVGRGRSRVRSDAAPSERAEWCATRDAGRGRGRAARGGHSGRGDGARLRHARRSAAPGARVLRSDRASRTSGRTSTRRGRCACRPVPRATGPARRRLLGQHTEEVLREELGVDRRRARAPARPST